MTNNCQTQLLKTVRLNYGFRSKKQGIAKKTKQFIFPCYGTNTKYTELNN